MAETADAIVIGGGIAGASAAFHLASRGAGRVILCERHRLGAGATGASGAFIQYHFCQNEAEARLTQASMPYFERWDELVGAGSCGFVSCGYLRLEPESRVDALTARVAMLRNLGIDSRIVGPQDISHMAPYLSVDGVAVAAYEPASGYADAQATVDGFVEAATRARAGVWAGCEVTAIRASGGAVTGVETTRGPISAPVVILAAGAWSLDLLRRLGHDLPVNGALTQWFGFTMPGALPAPMMTVGDGVSGSYFRPGDTDNSMLGGLGGDFRRQLDQDNDERGEIPAEMSAIARERLGERLAGMGAPRVSGGRSGPITTTPDNLPIIDAVPGASGLFVFTGDCGASFKTGPAIGRALTDLALDGRTGVADLTAFAISRFDAGQDGQASRADRKQPARNFTVREATPEDLPSARALMLRVFELDFGYGYKPEYHADVDDLQDVYLDSPRHTLFVAVSHDGEVVGTAGVRSGGLKPEFNPDWLVARYDPERTAQLVRVYVAREWRGSGVARVLVDQTMRFVENDDSYDVLALHSDPRSPGAERFWRSMPTTLIHDDRDGPSGSLHFEMEIPGRTAGTQKARR